MAHLRNILAQRWNNIDASWRVAMAAFLITRFFYLLWSWVIFSIQPVAVQNFELSGEPILSVFQLESSDAHVYLREVNGGTLVFQAASKTHLIDQNTNSVWDISEGKAIQGPFKGFILPKSKTMPADLFPYHNVLPYAGKWLAMWQRFDANWYISIAEHGYGSTPGDDHFPPLFPLLIRILLPITKNGLLAGLVISHIATLIALKLLYDVFSQWGEKQATRRALIFFVLYPTFFFFFSAYSEPVFLLF
ncbi:MAG TPA: mannosyltransferase family protein, partial [Anaerolineales bacterium]|nr:mannosyltransferase family protein [Anaerolineales bacterium]